MAAQGAYGTDSGPACQSCGMTTYLYWAQTDEHGTWLTIKCVACKATRERLAPVLEHDVKTLRAYHARGG